MSAALEIATIDERDGCSLTLTAANQRDASKAQILGASMKRPLSSGADVAFMKYTSSIVLSFSASVGAR
jgi:hypothetical protein